jgi:hypothetical protein
LLYEGIVWWVGNGYILVGRTKSYYVAKFCIKDHPYNFGPLFQKIFGQLLFDFNRSKYLSCV